jgi:hypothetical protein
MPFVIASVFFSNPALWVGVFALGIPIGIHLLTRRTPRKLVFPTLIFLRSAMARQSNFYRLRHPLLLLARSLLLLLLLLAFLKPMLMQGRAGSAKDEQVRRTQVICLDASASMGYAAAGVTPFAQAQAKALKILANHRPGDQVNLIRIGAQAQSCLSAPSDSLFFLRKDIQSAVPTQEHANINAALAEAVRQLDGISDGRKQIFFISDFQRSNWSAVDFGTVSPDIELFFVPAAAQTPANCAVTDVTVRPIRPTAAEAVDIVCKVANYGDRAQRVPLQLRFLQGEVFDRDVLLEPHATLSTSFQVRFSQSGQYEGELVIPADGLSIDDRRCFTLTAARQVNILLVSDASGERHEMGSRFLERAVNPFVQARDATAVASLCRSGQLNSSNVSQAQVVILSEVNELSRTTAELLLTYLRDGGSVVYFHVGGADSHNLKLLADTAGDDFVCPFKITGQVALRQDEQHAVWSEANFDHRILRKFKESGELADLRFYRFFSTERKEQKGQVLLRYDDRNIAMSQATVGAGRLLLCNFSCSLQYSDIAKHTIFVPLIHEIIKCLRPGSGARNAFTVGDQCYMTVASISQDSQLEFKDPDNRPLEGSVDIGQSGGAVFFPRTDRCGFYRVYADDEVAGAMAVNVNPVESNLEALELSQLEGLAKTAHEASFSVSAGRSGIERALAGKPLWPYFLIAAVSLLFVELALVVICKH